MEKTDITIIGAGIIGLAVSAYVANKKNTVYVLEKNSTFGQEASSRNSEVIHSGIYYPQNSLKTRTCVEGNQIVYEICKKNNIACKKLGKLVVATERQETKHLERLLENGMRNGVPGLKLLSAKEVKKLEPDINAKGALLSLTAGIVDSHNLMSFFLQKAKAQEAEFAFCSEVIAIAKQNPGYKITVRDADGSNFSFGTNILINCAGLNSDIIAQLSGIDIKQADYSLNFCKGEYFRLSNAQNNLIKHLVYPLPDPDGLSLGVHITPDLTGNLRLGPNARFIERTNANYNVQDSQKDNFYTQAKKLLPFINRHDLVADTAGIRPKLQGPNDSFRDFVICEEGQRNLTGLINLIGIDSPGLTASPAIAKRVSQIVQKLL